MNSVCKTLPCSLEYVPPSADYLFNSKVEGKKLEIEDGLCTPNNQEVFLTASMAFLQIHLIQKLRNDIRMSFAKKSHRPQRTSSDLLLVESCSKLKETKYFIRVKNVERYDEILKNEAAIPRETLSLNQILPAPKKTLWLKPPIFKKKSSRTSILDCSEIGSTYSFFGTLKRNLFRSKRTCSSSESQCTLNGVSMRCQLYVNALPSKTSISTINSLKNLNKESSTSSLVVNRVKMAPSFINPLNVIHDSNTIVFPTPETSSCGIKSIKIKSDLDSPQSLTMDLQRNKNLSQNRRELEFSKYLLCGQQTPPLNQSLSETIREIKNLYKYIHKNYHTREAPTLKSSSTVNVLARCCAQTQIKPQQPNMSVFLEENLELTNYSSTCTNFTDEFKSRFSSEYVPSLLSKSKSDVW